MTLLLAFAGVLAVAPVVRSQESAWVAVEGVATLAGDISMDRAQAAALDNARVRAVEQSFGTTLSDEGYAVRSQDGLLSLFRETHALTTGHVTQEEILGWEFRNMPTKPGDPPALQAVVHLRARVSPAIGENADFHVALQLARRAFQDGDPLTMTISANQSCSLTVLNLAADGKIRVIYPNRYRPAVEVAAGQPCTLPGEKDPFQLLPRPLLGHTLDVEAIKVLGLRHAAPKPMPLAADGTIALPELYHWLLEIPTSQRCEATVEYRVVSRTTESPQPRKEAL